MPPSDAPLASGFDNDSARSLDDVNAATPSNDEDQATYRRARRAQSGQSEMGDAHMRRQPTGGRRAPLELQAPISPLYLPCISPASPL